MLFVLFRSCVFVGFLLIASGGLAQQKKGEIININYKYKVAFTDLTEGDVKSGDMVTVALPDGKPAFLEVVEAYPVMAKLSISSDPKNSITDDDFSKISVGAIVQPLTQVKGAVNVKQGDVPVKTSVIGTESSQDFMPGQNSIEVFEPGSSVKKEENQVTGKERDNNEVSPPVELKRSIRPAGKSAVKPIETAVQKIPVREVEPFVAVRVEPVAVEPSDAKAPVVQPVKVVGIDERIDKLTSNMMNLSEHIARLLTDKGNLEAALKEKETAFVEMRKKAEELSALNITLDGQVKSLQIEVNRLKAKDADSQKVTADLEMKLSELKKKLARMVDIINKHMKSYE